MIKFNKPFRDEKEMDYLVTVLQSGKTSGDGFFTKKVHRFLEEKFGVWKALFTTSCSSALDMAGILLNLGTGDEVILPSYTFVSTANAVVLRGATPVFVDVEADTLNLDPDEIEKKITTKTKALFPVHYAGVACQMGKIMEIAKRYRFRVVEDAAQGFNAKYNDRYLGTIGDIGCFSFHETKNISCGEGGAILINNPELAERAEIVREKGTNRSKFFRGQIDKYSWVDVGSSYLPSDILAALLYRQLEMMEYITEKRQERYDYYYRNLRELEEWGYLRLPVIPEGCQSNYHLFYLIMNSERAREELIDSLRQQGIEAFFHFVPLHLSSMGRGYGYQVGDLPKTELLSARLIRLPLYPSLSLQEQNEIIEAIYQCCRGNYVHMIKKC